MLQLMHDYGDSKFLFFGKNESSEDVIISIVKDIIVVRTLQNNGWTRRNIYSVTEDHIISEEIYEPAP